MKTNAMKTLNTLPSATRKPSKKEKSMVEDQLELQDLYECSLFRTNFKDILLNKRFYIDPKVDRLTRFFEEFNEEFNNDF